MKQVIFHDEATSELLDAVDYYEKQKPGLGIEFQSYVGKAVDSIVENPTIWSYYQETELQKYTIEKFPYLIFYVNDSELIWIMAIAHGKRRPNYWKNRLRSLSDGGERK